MKEDAPPAPPAAPLWADYEVAPNRFDELFDATGAPRAHTQRLGRAIGGLTPAVLEARWDRVQRELRENGVTYNVYDDSRGADRPWQLDPIPLPLLPGEFADLAAGLSQRAGLLDLVLQDFYGPQALVREGLLPPELLLQNPGFLRPCHVGTPPFPRFLHIYAADLLRGADGTIMVLGDRTQAPSGMGYALENRIVLSRAFPNIYRDTRVERLAPFFRALLDTIAALSPRNHDRPHAVLLTPGPYNETYFEHAYLARYLGLSLVEGADLTVRDRVVYLKTLGGLQRVDVILRRLDDNYCDPLSLRSDSALGVAGLLSAVRAGNVAVLNGLGSGAVETPALHPFLPALSQRLLQEPLRLSSVPTLWLGQPESLEQAIDRFDTMVFKPAYPTPGAMEPVFGAALGQVERDALVARMRARPTRFIAQDQIRMSTSPSYERQSLTPRAVSIRAYAVSSEDGYHVMPGGLTRVSRDQQFPRVSMQYGAGSKDTWVLSDRPVTHTSLLGSGDRRLALSRGGGDLPSRVADNLFWLGRYLERVEGTSRLVRELLERLTDELPATDSAELPVLCHALAIHTELDARIDFAKGASGPEQLERDLLAFLSNPRAGNSLLASMAGAHRVAFTVRERLSSDTWRVLGQLRRIQRELAGAQKLTVADALDLLNQAVLTASAFSGLQMESLSRTLAFRFIDLGRRLERAQGIARLLWSTLTGVSGEESAVLISILTVFDNAITYRRRYQGVVQLAPALDLLLIDEGNPRSLAYQFAMLLDHLESLPRAEERSFRTREEQLALKGLTQLRLSDIEALSEPGADGARGDLDSHLQGLLTLLPEISDAITQHYLAHAAPQQSFGVQRRGDSAPPVLEGLPERSGQQSHGPEGAQQQAQAQQQSRRRGRP